MRLPLASCSLVRRAPNTKRLNFEEARRRLWTNSVFYLGLSFALFRWRCFSFLSLVVITDTHSCNFFFRVPEIKKWESGSTTLQHLTFPSSLTVRLKFAFFLAVSRTKLLNSYLDPIFVSHNINRI
jgi:hypothetical protein